MSGGRYKTNPILHMEKLRPEDQLLPKISYLGTKLRFEPRHVEPWATLSHVLKDFLSNLR